MDKTGIIVVSICVLLLGWWFIDQKKMAEQQAHFQATNQIAMAQAALTNSTATNAPGAPAAAASATVTPAFFGTNAPEQTLVLTNGGVRYTFTSRGGGLKLVELLKYPETISPRWEKTKAASDTVASLNTRAPLPVLAIIGSTNLTGDGHFTLTQIPGGVRAEKLLPDGLRMVKNFQLSSNYLVNASVTLENTTSNALEVPARSVVLGTATPMDADDSTFPVYGGTVWYDGQESQDTRLSYFNPSPTFLGVFHRTVHTDYHAGAGNVVWAAVDNQYFALLTMTATNQPAQSVSAWPVTLPAFPGVEQAAGTPLPQGVTMTMNYPAGTLAPRAAIERELTLYAGPKEYRKLVNIAEQRNNRADLVMNFGTGYIALWGVGTFFAKLLLSAMNGLHDLTGVGYGWTIVLITILIKALFWPLTAKATRSMKKMQALAPEVSALKEKYKDDQQKLMQKQMELWKKNKVSPMSGCLPMLIQMPVFLGFYTMIRSAIELRGAHWLWVADLSKPDTIFMIPGTHFPFNLLPLLMGGAMLWQSHLQPPSPGMEPGQQKLMRWMPAIFILFLYNYSSGLALYWTVNNLLTVLQTKLTRATSPVALAAPTGPETNPALTPASKKKK